MSNSNWLLISWRNLWRNKRRTLITIASIFFAVVLAVLMRGFKLGSWVQLIDGVLHSYSGYLQVHKKGYWDDKSLENTFYYTDSLENMLTSVNGVKAVVPRAESFALACNLNKSKGVLVAGVQPDVENNFTALKSKLTSGCYFANKHDSGALVSQRLARFLKIKTGDTLILISRGYHNVSASGLFPVRGIVKLPSPEFDNQMVFITLYNAQQFFSIPGQLTSLVVDIKKPQQLDKIAQQVTEKLPASYEVMTWKEMIKELYQQFQTEEGGAVIFLSLLYSIVGFGIFGTVLMMVTERTREFSIMIAIGMRKHRLTYMVASEMFLIGLAGLFLGLLGSIPVLLYFHYFPIQLTGEMAKTMEIYGMEPILPIAWQTDYIINQMLIVGLITVLAIIYPLYRIYSLDITKTLRK